MIVIRSLCCVAALLFAGCQSLDTDPEMLKADARWQAHQGQPNAALRTLRRAIELSPDDVEAHALLAQVALRADRPGEAETVLRRAVELDPRDPDLRVARGIALTRLGRYEAAEAVLLHALLLRPADPATLVSLAEVYRLWGEPEKCVSRYGQFAWQREHAQPTAEQKPAFRVALERAKNRKDHCGQRESF